jgi:hypothetical protein
VVFEQYCVPAGCVPPAVEHGLVPDELPLLELFAELEWPDDDDIELIMLPEELEWPALPDVVESEVAEEFE